MFVVFLFIMTKYTDQAKGSQRPEGMASRLREGRLTRLTASRGWTIKLKVFLKEINKFGISEIKLSPGYLRRQK